MRFMICDPKTGEILKEFNSSDVKKAKAHAYYLYQDRIVEVVDITTQLCLFPDDEARKSIRYEDRKRTA